MHDKERLLHLRDAGEISVGLCDPGGLVEAVIVHHAAIVSHHIVNLFRLVVEMEGRDVKVIIVGRRIRVGDERFEELAEPVLVVPVGHSRHVDDGIRIGFIGDSVGDAQQLDKVIHRATPRHVRRAGGNLWLVPDGPMVDTAGVTADDGADKVGPQIVGVIGGEVETLGDARADSYVGGPAGRGDQQPGDLAALGQLVRQSLVRDGSDVPLCGAIGLDSVPLEGDARPARAQRGGGVWGGVGLDDAKAVIRAALSNGRWMWQEAGDKKRQQSDSE
ncbi:MAG: hypothetical protein B6I35_04910 [Anaerolineaceae bacterium 4572_32.2]|nr:MAG: hypothetical protein B6I35_04910 [Anaerolineaceae bacterium 4572_32.2]RLC82314.1 MAG: hypothetical protein DRI81_00165 [Chloroflexota bacterium]